MAVTDQEFARLKQRVADLEAKNIGQRLASLRSDLDALAADQSNAHAAFIDLRVLVDDLVMQVDALTERVAALEAVSDPMKAAA